MICKRDFCPVCAHETVIAGYTTYFDVAQYVMDGVNWYFGTLGSSKFQYIIAGTFLSYNGHPLRFYDDAQLQFGNTPDGLLYYDEAGVDRVIMGGPAIWRATSILEVTDAVTSGDPRRVGGNLCSTVAVGTEHTSPNPAAWESHAGAAASYVVKANTFKAGTVAKAHIVVKITDNNGADTIQIRIRLGGSVIVTSAATNPNDNDKAIFDIMLKTRAAPGAAVAVFCYHKHTVPAGVAWVVGYTELSLATNGALTLDVQDLWSAFHADNQCEVESITVDVVG